MDYPANLWDLSIPQLPQQLAPIDDTDFLSILSKQLNPSATAAPAQITELSPPLTEDSSSPSPPTANKGLAKASGSTDRSGNDMHKRKKQDTLSDDDDDDDLDDQPQSKVQREQGRKNSTKRKSTGGPDESRAQKRKEQNRAAQRAFRERKEKHVRDLEEQVAALETKNSAQASENENLRELLGRLQNENLMLKQSAFTFNFPNAATPKSAGGSASRPSPSASSPADSTANKSNSPSSGVAVANRDSPINTHQQSNLSGGASSSSNAGYTPLLSFSSVPAANKSSPDGSSDSPLNPTSPTNMTPPMSFFSPPPSNPVPSPYQTLAANPMYTSYTDFSAWDQFFADVAMDQTLAGVTMPSQPGSSSNMDTISSSNNGHTSGNMEDLFASTGNFNDLIPFSGFSPSASGMSPFVSMTPIQTPPSTSDSPVMHMSHTTGGNNGPANAFSLESRNTDARPSLAAPRSSSPCGGADPDEAPLPGSSGYNPSHAIQNINGSRQSSGADHDQEKCPTTVGEVAKIIEAQPLSTFGEPVPDEKATKLKKVWEEIKNDTRFSDLDMDELCRELQAKAKCSGDSTSDVPCEALMEVIQEQRARNAAKANSSPTTPTIVASNTSSPQQAQQQSQQQPAAKPQNYPYQLPPNTGFPNFQTFQPMAIPVEGRQASIAPSSTSNDTGSLFSNSPSIATPASSNLDINMGQANNGFTTTNMDWSNVPMDAPSPMSQFLNYLNTGANMSGGFSPSRYLNLGEESK